MYSNNDITVKSCCGGVYLENIEAANRDWRLQIELNCY